MIYTVTINPSLDYVMILKEVRLGGLNRSSREVLLPGGKGINVSIVLNHLGVRNTCLGFIAGSIGKEVERGLWQRECITDFIELEHGCTRINVKAKEVSGRESELNGNGPRIDADCLNKLEEKVAALQEQDTLILSGNVPREVPDDIYGRLAKALEGKRVRLVVDAEGPLLFPALPYKPFLVKPNLNELCGMLGRKVEEPKELERGARELREKGAGNVLISLGKDGAFFLGEDNTSIWLSAPKGTVINTVGSGDSMIAGFISGCERGLTLEESACYAVAAGSAGAFSELLPERENIDRLYREIRERRKDAKIMTGWRVAHGCGY